MLREIVVRTAIIVLLTSSFALGQSQQRPAQTQKIQSQNTPPAQTAAPDKRGTDDVPLAIKILPTQDAKEKAEKAERERIEKAVTDKHLADETQRLANYTGALFIVTCLLFGAALFQVGLFWFQLRIMKGGLKDAAKAANAAAAGAQSAKESTDLARQEFIAAHRPRIHARFFPELPIDPDTPLVVTFEAVNAGDLDATLIRVELSVYDFALGETVAPRWASTIPVNQTNLRPSEISPRYRVEITIPTIGGTPAPLLPGQMEDLRVRGRFFYSDSGERVRVTQFYRRYDPERRALRIVVDTDSDYEYED